MDTICIDGREIKVPSDVNGYWRARAGHDLYRLTVSLARGMFPSSRSVIDVGCYVSGLICELDWIDRRVACDLNPRITPNWEGVPGVQFVSENAFSSDFLQRLPRGRGELFDLVISNQTIEHVKEPAMFVEKLLSIGRGLLISTTYEVPTGMIDGHIQDPIDLDTFLSWFPCNLDAWLICFHPSRKIKHIVGVVKNSHPNAQ